MEIREIENYLSTKNTQINNSVGEAIEEHRNRFILAKDEAQANYCWCLRQIYRIQNKYVWKTKDELMNHHKVHLSKPLSSRENRFVGIFGTWK